jgi:(S)-ureidoglycine aminohydrolase
MKIFISLLLFIFNIPFLQAQSDTVLSDVYKFYDIKSGDSKINMIKGNTTDIEDFRVDAFLIKPGKSFGENISRETLIIVKEGEVEAGIREKTKKLNPGSIAYIMPDEDYYLKNTGGNDAVIYQLLYKSRLSSGSETEKKENSSFLISWDELVYKPHERGGIRQYFENQTSMFKRFEMHVTTLNAGITSHEPHTHRAEEIVLMIDGNSEMQIGTEFKKGSAGDLFFLGADVPHALRNAGEKPCMYFAFQWE